MSLCVCEEVNAWDMQAVYLRFSVLSLLLLAGVKNHHKIVFRGEADERPGEIPGDVVLVVEQQARCAQN